MENNHIFAPILSQLAAARATATDTSLDPKVRGLRLLALCKNISEQMGIVYEILDDIERHKPQFRDQVHALRIRLQNIQMEFRKLTLELNLELL